MIEYLYLDLYREMTTCSWCGDQFEPSRRRKTFCSFECGFEWHLQEHYDGNHWEYEVVP